MQIYKLTHPFTQTQPIYAFRQTYFSAIIATELHLGYFFNYQTQNLIQNL